MKIVKSVNQIKTKDNDSRVQLKDVPCGDVFYVDSDSVFEKGNSGFYVKGLKRNGSHTHYPCIQLTSGLNRQFNNSTVVQHFPKGVFVTGEED